MLIESLNIVALAGWSYVGFLLMTTSADDLVEEAFLPTLLFESICWMEVIRIAIGDLAGNLTLGFILHACRTLVLTVVFPNLGTDHAWVVQGVLGSWAVTEITRYPMYILGKSAPPVARLVRMTVPLVTFPIGAGSEAYGAYLVLMANYNNDNNDDNNKSPSLPIWIQGALVIMMGIQVFLGPTMAYPVIVKKALQEVGILKKKPKKTTPTAKKTE